jgi:hypothetical protein
LNDWLEKQDKDSILLVELFNINQTECLVHSIKVKDIQENASDENQYIRVGLNKEEDFANSTIEKLPTLLVYNGNKFLGKIEGYFDDSEHEKFIQSIQNLLLPN